MQGPLRLGVAERKITPPLGGYLYGYPSPPRSTAVHDDLTVTALYFEEGDTRALLLSFTICSLSSALCRRLAALLELTEHQRRIKHQRHKHKVLSEPEGHQHIQFAVCACNDKNFNESDDCQTKSGFPYQRNTAAEGK